MSSQTYTGKNRSQNYRAGDSMIYHQSMFLKRLSHAAPEGEKKVGWRQKLGHFLESKPENIFIFSLIVLDLLVICAQLFVIDPHEHCNGNNNVNTTNSAIISNTSHFSQMEVYSLINPPPHNESSSSEHHHHSEEPESPEDRAYEIAGAVLNDVSLTILGILGVESVLMIIAFDVEFFKQPLYILDAVVIGASLFLEIKEESTLAKYGSLMIFFRLWRIVRIIHGVAMSVQEKNEETIKKLEAEVEHLEKEKTTLSTKLEYLKKKYKKLVSHKEDDDGLPKLPNYDHSDHPPLPSLAHPRDYDPHAHAARPAAAAGAATHAHAHAQSPPTTKSIRIQDDRSDADSDDYSDGDNDDDKNRNKNKKSGDDVIVGINDDRAVRQPLVRSPRTSEYSTFAKK